MRFRLEPTTSIDEGASTLTRIQCEIGNLKKSAQPSEDLKIEALLSALGPEYEPIIASLDSGATLVYEDVVARLRKAEARLKGVDTATATDAKAYFTTANQRQKGACHHCGKKGHYKRECQKWLAERSQQ